MLTPFRLLVAVLVTVSGCRCGEGGLIDDGGTPEDGGVLADGGMPTVDAGMIDAGDLFEACEIPAQAGGSPAECAPIPVGVCSTGADCPSGICLALATGRVCTQACAVDADCTNARVCDRRTTGSGVEGFCVPSARGGL